MQVLWVVVVILVVYGVGLCLVASHEGKGHIHTPVVVPKARVLIVIAGNNQRAVQTGQAPFQADRRVYKVQTETGDVRTHRGTTLRSIRRNHTATKRRTVAKIQQYWDTLLIWRDVCLLGLQRYQAIVWVEDDFVFCEHTTRDWEIVLDAAGRMEPHNVIHVSYGFSGLVFRPKGFRHWTQVLSKWDPSRGSAIDNEMVKRWGKHLHVWRWSLLQHVGTHTSTIEEHHVSLQRAQGLPQCLDPLILAVVSLRDTFDVESCPYSLVSPCETMPIAVTRMRTVDLARRYFEGPRHLPRAMAQAGVHMTTVVSAAGDSCTAACTYRRMRCDMRYVSLLNTCKAFAAQGLNCTDCGASINTGADAPVYFNLGDLALT